MSLNKVMLIGNVGREPEIIDKDGRKVAKLSVATTEKYTDKGGNRREDTEWHNVTAFGYSAEFVSKFVNSGDKVYVEGKIRTNEYTDRNGEKKRSFGIEAERIEKLGSRADGRQDAGGQQYRNAGNSSEEEF